MRFQNLALGVVGVGALTFGAAAGCGSNSGTGGSGGGNGGSTTTTMTTSTSTGTSMTTSTSTGTGAGCPPAACKVADKSCLGLVDNTGKTKFGLRMAELDVTKPAVLSMGSIEKTVASAVEESMASCALKGTATFSWLLEFDTVAGTLKTGGAKPVTDPTMGYAFDMETLMGQAVAPITVMTKPDAMGNFGNMTGQNLVVPIFLTADASSYVLLPIQQARITSGTLSANNNCIGTYNGSTLSPMNSCQPATGSTLFTDGGKLDGHITLAGADTVNISVLGESLCCLLTQDATTYCDGATPVSHCKKNAAGAYTFQGDWCDATNMAAGGGCADSVQLQANFAANSVLITN